MTGQLGQPKNRGGAEAEAGRGAQWQMASHGIRVRECEGKKTKVKIERDSVSACLSRAQSRRGDPLCSKASGGSKGIAAAAASLAYCCWITDPNAGTSSSSSDALVPARVDGKAGPPT